MAMPGRMQQEAEEADKFLENMNQPGEPTPAEQVPETGGLPTSTPATPPAGSEEVDTLRAEVTRLQQLLADENSPTYRHRYEVLVGKYNAEIPRLAEKIRELEARLNEAPAAPAAPQTNPEYEAAYHDLEEEYGPTTAKSILTIAQSLAQEQIAAAQQQFEAQLQERLQPYDEQVQQLAQTQAQTAQERFFSTLDALVPDWKQINGWRNEGIAQNPAFGAFLNETVPGGDFTFNDLLLQHYKRGNALKVKEVFDIFKSRNTAAPAAPPSKQVEQYIDPSKTGRGAAPPNNQPKTYTRAEIDSFYDSRLKGTFRGTREEAQRLEAEYEQAMLEGRVR